MKVKVSLDNVSYTKKPLQKIPQIKYRTAENWNEWELSELADLVGNKGHAMTPAHLVDGIKAKNCVGMQLFALDFDKGIRFDEVKDRCERYKLPIAFAYHTYSSQEHEEKFRVVFVHNTVIEDAYVISIIINMFHKVFPECDSSCTNLDRLFLGGKELIYVDDEARYTCMQLLFIFCECLDRNNNFKRNIESFCKNNRIMLVNRQAAMGPEGVLQVLKDNDVFLESSNVHIIADDINTSFCIIEKNSRHANVTCRIKKRRLDVNEDSYCSLLADFNSGIELDHYSKFAIISNLQHIVGGQKHFLDTLWKNKEFESYEKWSKDVKYIKSYSPIKCSEKYCPYYYSCTNPGTILNTLRMNRKVKLIDEIKLYSLEEAQSCFQDNLEEAFNSKAEGIHLIKAQTSIGKTYSYIELINKYSADKFIVAVPTNQLKEQVANDLCNKIGKENVFVTPSVNGNLFFDEEMQYEIMSAHNRGIHNKTKEIVSNFLEDCKDNPNKKAVVEECQKIIDGMLAIKQERVIVTTHAYFLHINMDLLKPYNIIIDEDILQLQMLNCCKTVRVECLKQLITENISGFSDIAQQMIRAKEMNYERIVSTTYVSPLDDKILIDIGCLETDNVNDLLYATSFVKCKDRSTGEEIIKYFCPQMLQRGKYIILSATLNECIYRKYFENHLRIYTYIEKKAKYKGKVLQYTYHSLGRNTLYQDNRVFGFLKKISKGKKLDIITFKSLKTQKATIGHDISDLHFGNTTGINSLSGRDIAIIGTPFKAEEAYKLVACHLGADVNKREDVCPRLQRIQYKNYSFIMLTYMNPLLREIQLYSIESELEQCIGRARLLRNDCIVYVFSSFPCEQAEVHIEDYLRKNY